MIKQSSSNINIMLLAQRVLASCAFLFLTIGETLHFNAFLQNAIDLGLPYPQTLCTVILVLSFVCSALILIGFAFRMASFVMAAITLGGGIIFFAGDFNKVSVVVALLATALFAGFIAAGPGEISLHHLILSKKNKFAKQRLPRH